MPHGIRSEKGFSLIESMVALAIGLVLLLAAGQFFIRQVEVTVSQEQTAEMQQNARFALDIMIRSLRMAGYDPSGNAGAGLTTASPAMVSFSMDLNADGDATDPQENVLFQLMDADGDGDLDLIANDAQDVIADNIADLRFSYSLADGSVTDAPSDLSQVRIVGITLMGQAASDHQGSIPAWTVAGKALLRNMALRPPAAAP